MKNNFLIYSILGLIFICGYWFKSPGTPSTKERPIGDSESVNYSPPVSTYSFEQYDALREEKRCEKLENDFREAEKALTGNLDGAEALAKYNATFQWLQKSGCNETAEARENKKIELTAIASRRNDPLAVCLSESVDGFEKKYVVVIEANEIYAINGTARAAAARAGWIDGNTRFSMSEINRMIEQGLQNCRPVEEVLDRP